MCFDCGCCVQGEEDYTEKCEECLDRECCDFYIEVMDERRIELEEMRYNMDDPRYEDMNPYDFRDPGGNSALRNGPRIHPCPTCGEPNKLSPADVALHYQCDECADQLERGW